MSLRKPPEARRQYIKKNVGTKQLKDIAKDCGVSEKTIDRDVAYMKGTGEWQDFIEYEALRLHREIGLKEDPLTAYKEFMKLYAKTITSKTEAKLEGNLTTEFRVVFDKSMDDNGESSNPV